MLGAPPKDRGMGYLVYLKCWALNLRPSMVYPKVLHVRTLCLGGSNGPTWVHLPRTASGAPLQKRTGREAGRCASTLIILRSLENSSTATCSARRPLG